MEETQAQQTATEMHGQSLVVSGAAQTIVITSDVEYEQAAKLLMNVKEKIKLVDEKRKEFTGPLNKTVKNINAFFKAPLDDYRAAEQALKLAMAKFHNAREEARKQALLEAQKAAQSQEKAVFVEKMEKAADNQAPEAAGTHTREVMCFEVVDPSLVPRHYCTPDDKKIRAALDNVTDNVGEKSLLTIPGVRVWKETKVVAHGIRK
jgi:hypothetical protein